MLEALFGNSVIEKILFYLHKNQTCYPSELKNLLQTPLYSFQKALDRLERGGVVVHQKQGKTLVYQFNPRYPFLKELLAFLDKTYEFLPNEIKNKHYEPLVRKRPRRKGKPL